MSDQTPIRTFDIVVTQGYDIEEVDRPTGDYVRAEDVATLTARCEALDMEVVHLTSERSEADRRCEALTAERDEVKASLATEREHYGPLQQLNLELLTRCQHLEQAVRAVNRHHWNEDGTACVDASCTKSHWLDGHAVEAALASLLPTQEEPPGTDENRVSFAAGYTTALDDALKGK